MVAALSARKVFVSSEETMKENFIAALLMYFVSAVFVGVWLGLVINIIKLVSF
jgi:hypothetical protein